MTNSDDLPPPDLLHLARRERSIPPGSLEWTGDGTRDAADHHGMVSLNVTPCFIRLRWTSADRARTVEVGQYKLSLSGLASHGYVKKDGRKVRLRFRRRDDGLVVIQENNSGPALPIGRADFEQPSHPHTNAVPLADNRD